jgi:hypothetical protein
MRSSAVPSSSPAKQATLYAQSFGHAFSSRATTQKLRKRCTCDTSTMCNTVTFFLLLMLLLLLLAAMVCYVLSRGRRAHDDGIVVAAGRL